jgi:predicted ribosomally synthesized peptide with SipW-like signal peptide
MAEDNDGIRLSRRKALAGLGSIGAATALGGVGTFAQFTDTEEETFTFTAGGVDGEIIWGASYNGNDVRQLPGSDTLDDGGVTSRDVDFSLTNVEQGVDGEVHFSDVKPGDYGCFSFLIKVENNPAWAASCLDYTETDGYAYEPELEEDDDHAPLQESSAQGEAGTDYQSDGEFSNNMLVIPFYKNAVTSSTADRWNPCVFFDAENEEFTADYRGLEVGGDVVGATASDFWSNAENDLDPLELENATEAISPSTVGWGVDDDGQFSSQTYDPSTSIALDPGCVFLNGAVGNEQDNSQAASALTPGTWYGFGWDWHVPFDVGNEMQGDKLELNIGFVFGQVRHTESVELSNIYAPGQNLPDDG